MATNYSSPTANLFDLLKPEDDKKGKQPTKQPAAKQPAKRLTPEEKSRQEAERQRQANEKKMEAALANQHDEETTAQGFTTAPTASGKATKAGSHLSRAEWEAKKAKGESLTVAEPEPERREPREPRTHNNTITNNNNNNSNNINNNQNHQARHHGNRNFDNPNEIKEQRQPNHPSNNNRQGGDHQERRGPKPGREFDRHSQAQTGRKYNEKRGGGGKFNLGNPVEPIAGADVPVDDVEKVNAALVSEPASTDASAVVSTAVDEKKVQVVDIETPEDEGYGKKTMSEYEKQRIAEAENLAKLVGTIEKRTDVDKKIDLSKCIEADKHDEKYSKHAKAHAKPNNASAKPKAKTLEFNEFLKQEGVTNPQANQQRNRGPNPNNKRIPRDNQFPSLGEEPQQRNNNNNYRSEQSESRDWNNGNDDRSNNSSKSSNYQGQRQNNRPPRQQGQGVQQGQGSQQPQPQGQGQGQGQRQQGQGNRQQGQGQRQQGQGQGQQGQGQFRGNNQGQGQRSQQGTA